MPGKKSSARMSRAMRPPMKKKMKQLTMYMMPSIL